MIPPPPPPPIVSFMVFLFFFLKRPCSLTFHHSYRGRHPRLFSYGNTYLLYIYISIFCKSHKVQKPSWSGERIFAKGFRFLLTLPCGSGLLPLLLGLGWKKEKKKKDALTKESEKESSLLSLAPFTSWPQLCPPSSLAVELQMPFQQSSASWRVLGIFGTCTLEYVVWVLCSWHHRNQTHIPTSGSLPERPQRCCCPLERYM